MKKGLALVCLLLTLGMGSLARAADRDTAMALLTGVDDLCKKGSFDKALEMCQRAVTMDDSCPEIFFQMGNCYEQLRQPREAIQNYTKAENLARKEDNSGLA